MIDALSERIWARPEFQNDYHELIRMNLRRSLQISSVDGYSNHVNQSVLRRLLQTATHFSAAENSSLLARLHEAAYRIVIGAWQVFGDEFDNLDEAAGVVLGRLGNFPAADFLSNTVAKPTRGNDTPLLAAVENLRHRDRNSVDLAGFAQLTLTDFQVSLWSTLDSRASAAVTAPTSAGKSYALQRYLVSRLVSAPGHWGLYVVPTRALINQVSASLAGIVASLQNVVQAAAIRPVESPSPHTSTSSQASEERTDGAGASALVQVSTIPLAPSELGAIGGIYVLTQERAQILLDAAPDLAFDVAIIDEAQMLGEESRGVILQTVVDRILQRSSGTQIMFGSPQTNNPEIFGRVFSLDNLRVLRDDRSPVAQNIIFLDMVGSNVAVRALIDGENESVGTVQLAQRPRAGDPTLAYLSREFSRGEKSLIYAGSRSRCEKIAGMLVELVRQSGRSVDETIKSDLDELSKFVRDHVHRDYSLADVLTEGVAFHYGNIPSVIRKAVESYFDEGMLNYLVCTSTLLHGVNLPAKNLFLLDPTKGREWRSKETRPITSLDFWNLAGRAGRLGRDFEGNVFLINRDSWKLNPLAGARAQNVRSAIEETITDRKERFLAYIKDRDHASGSDQASENAFVKLFNEARLGNIEKFLARTLSPSYPQIGQDVLQAIAQVIPEISVPQEVTESNIYVSVYRQQEMYNYMLQRISDGDPESLIPMHPSSGGEVYNSYVRLFSRIHTRFEKKPTKNRTHTYYAQLALRWMRGEPLPRLIDESYNYKVKSSPKARIGTTIRKVLDDIENDLRFRYVKFTSCYVDLLKAALRSTGKDGLIESIPAVPLFLELGASSRTMISLIGLGMSRTSAGIVVDFATNDEMDRVEAGAWLRRQDWNAFDISRIVRREIREIVGGN